MDTSCEAWARVGTEAWALGVDSSIVVALRLARIASGGDPAGTEARLMVTEKLASIWELTPAMVGLTPLAMTRRALDYYAGKVAANRQRLLAGR